VSPWTSRGVIALLYGNESIDTYNGAYWAVLLTSNAPGVCAPRAEAMERVATLRMNPNQAVWSAGGWRRATLLYIHCLA